MSKNRFVLCSLVALLPALALFYLLTHCWVNVIYWDEWAIFPILSRIHQHTATWQDYFAQANDARPFFPKILFVILGKLFHWDLRAFMAGTFLVVCCTSLLLLRLLHTTSQQLFASSKHRLTLACIIAWTLINVFLFSLAQWENWFWGMQLMLFVPALMLLIALQIDLSDLDFRLKVGLIVLCNLVATYSFSNGILVWLLAFPAQNFFIYLENKIDGNPKQAAAKKPSFSWIGFYLASGAAAIGFYFYGFKSQVEHTSFLQILRQPVLAMEYFLAWIASPFYHLPTVAPLFHGNALQLGDAVGALLLLITVALCAGAFIAISNRGGGIRKIYPWFILLAYAFETGLVTTVGRMSFTPYQAFSSRYISFSNFLPIALIGITFLIWQMLVDATRAESPKRLRFLAAASAVTSVLIALFVHNLPSDLRTIELHYYRLLEGLYALQNVNANPTDPALNLVCPMTPDLRVKTVEDLTSAGVLNINRTLASYPREFTAGTSPLRLVTKLLYKLKISLPYHAQKFAESWKQSAPSETASDANGYLDQCTLIRPDTLHVHGWAIDDATQKTVSKVWITLTNDLGESKVIAQLPTGVLRSDVAIVKNQPNFGYCGFEGIVAYKNPFSSSTLSLRIVAWAETTNGEFKQLR